MPVVNCPKCPTKLKIPDGVSGNTKCPKCGTVFPVSAPKSAPAFEVVDESAPAPAASSQKATAAPKPTVKKSQSEDSDVEIEEAKPKKRVVADADDDDDDDTPKKKKKKRDDDDDDDDDDTPKKKKKRSEKTKKKKKKSRDYEYDDDDDDDDWQPRPGNRGAFGKGKIGAMLLSISFWLNLGAYGLLALYALILWIMVLAASSSSPSRGGGGGSSRGGGDGDGSFMDIIVILPGLIGLGAWIVGTIGCAFSIAGPARARGMAITATVFAGIHLILTGVTFSNFHGSSGGMGMTRGMGVGSPAWIVVASTLPALDALLPLLFYASRALKEGDYIIALLAAICEVMRLIFALLTLKAMSSAARDEYAAEKSQFSMMTVIFVVGGVLLFVLLMVVLMAEGKFKSFETYAHLGSLTLLFTYLGYTFMMLNPAMAALQTKDACARRS